MSFCGRLFLFVAILYNVGAYSYYYDDYELGGKKGQVINVNSKHEWKLTVSKNKLKAALYLEKKTTTLVGKGKKAKRRVEEENTHQATVFISPATKGLGRNDVIQLASGSAWEEYFLLGFEGTLSVRLITASQFSLRQSKRTEQPKVMKITQLQQKINSGGAQLKKYGPGGKKQSVNSNYNVAQEMTTPKGGGGEGGEEEEEDHDEGGDYAMSVFENDYSNYYNDDDDDLNAFEDGFDKTYAKGFLSGYEAYVAKRKRLSRLLDRV